MARRDVDDVTLAFSNHLLLETMSEALRVYNQIGYMRASVKIT